MRLPSSGLNRKAALMSVGNPSAGALSGTSRDLGWRIVTPIVAVVGLFAIWQVVVSLTGINSVLLPSPKAVLGRLGTELANGSFLADMSYTLGEAALGCLVGAAVALPIGYAVASWRLVGAGLTPLIAGSQAIPAIAIAPLLALWAGYGLTAKVLLCGLMVFFPMLLNTVLGLRQVDRSLLEAAQLDGAHAWSLLLHIQAPLARRAILTGLRGGFTLSITGAVVGEYVIGGSRGLGRVVAVQTNMNDSTGLFATVLTLCVMAVAVYAAMVWLEAVTDPTRERKPA